MSVYRGGLIIVGVFLVLLPSIFGVLKSHFTSRSIVGYRRLLESNVHVDLSVYLEARDFQFPDIVEATQLQIDNELEFSVNVPVDWRITMRDGNQLTPVQSNTAAEDDYLVEIVLGPHDAVAVSEWSKRTAVFHTLDSVYSNDLPFFVTQTVLYHVYSDELNMLRGVFEDQGINYVATRKVRFVLLKGPVELNATIEEMEECIEEQYGWYADVLRKFVELDYLKNITEIDPTQQSVMEVIETIKQEMSPEDVVFLMQTPHTGYIDKPEGFYSINVPMMVMETDDEETKWVSLDNFKSAIKSMMDQTSNLLGLSINPQTLCLRVEFSQRYQTLRMVVESYRNLNMLVDYVPGLGISYIKRKHRAVVDEVVKDIERALERLTAGDWNESFRSSWNAFQLSNGTLN